MTFYKFRLDFEIGTLIKSPCRECAKYAEEFPRCINECKILDKIRHVLAETRPCSKG